MFSPDYIYIYIYTFSPRSQTATLYKLYLYIIWNVHKIEFSLDHIFYIVFLYEICLKFDISYYYYYYIYIYI